MQNPIAISYINIFLFIFYILEQNLSYTSVNYNGYPLRESKRNAMPAGKRISFFDEFVAIKNKIKVRLLLQGMLRRFKYHAEKKLNFIK